MPRRRSKFRDDKYSRSLVIKPQTTMERDLILEMGLPLTEELEVLIDTSPGRIELELRGEYNQVDDCLNKLRKLEHEITSALYPDRDGYYLYSADMLTQLCRPPVNLDLFAAAITAFKFNSSHHSGTLKSEAPLEDLTSIHQQVIDIREQILGEFNRDIERFFVIIALLTNSNDISQIIDTAINMELIKESEYGYQFTMAPEEAREKLLDQLGIDLGETLLLDEQDDLSNLDLGDLGFAGGKIVFLKDGKEIDPDELDM